LLQRPIPLQAPARFVADPPQFHRQYGADEQTRKLVGPRNDQRDEHVLLLMVVLLLHKGGQSLRQKLLWLPSRKSKLPILTVKSSRSRRRWAIGHVTDAEAVEWSSRGRQMRSGTHTPNGVEIRRLRILRGWNQEGFAQKVGVGKRTIERVENGRPTTIVVLKLVADALDVEVGTILGGAESNGDGHSQPHVIKTEGPEDELVNDDNTRHGESQVAIGIGAQGIQIRFPADFATWDRNRQLEVMAAIARLVGVRPTELDVIDLSEGSVLLTLALTPAQAEQLLWAVNQGELDAFGEVTATLVDIDARTERDTPPPEASDPPPPQSVRRKGQRTPIHPSPSLRLKTVRPSLLDLRFTGDACVLPQLDGPPALCLGGYRLVSVNALPLDLPTLNTILDRARHQRPRWQKVIRRYQPGQRAPDRHRQST
jgi:transcriptional regulator with XRE-family HTH domain